MGILELGAERLDAGMDMFLTEDIVLQKFRAQGRKLGVQGGV
jgi:hypothetical protein